MSLQFLAGAKNESVIIEVSKERRRRDPGLALAHLVFEFAHMRRPSFPMVIERGRVSIPVEGRQRSFTTYTAGRAAVAVGSFDGLDIVIRCAKTRLPKLALERIDLAELVEAQSRRDRKGEPASP